MSQAAPFSSLLARVTIKPYLLLLCWCAQVRSRPEPCWGMIGTKPWWESPTPLQTVEPAFGPRSARAASPCLVPRPHPGEATLDGTMLQRPQSTGRSQQRPADDRELWCAIEQVKQRASSSLGALAAAKITATG